VKKSRLESFAAPTPPASAAPRRRPLIKDLYGIEARAEDFDLNDPLDALSRDILFSTVDELDASLVAFGLSQGLLAEVMIPRAVILLTNDPLCGETTAGLLMELAGAMRGSYPETVVERYADAFVALDASIRRHLIAMELPNGFAAEDFAESYQGFLHALREIVPSTPSPGPLVDDAPLAAIWFALVHTWSADLVATAVLRIMRAPTQWDPWLYLLMVTLARHLPTGQMPAFSDSRKSLTDLDAVLDGKRTSLDAMSVVERWRRHDYLMACDELRAAVRERLSAGHFDDGTEFSASVGLDAALLRFLPAPRAVSDRASAKRTTPSSRPPASAPSIPLASAATPSPVTEQAVAPASATADETEEPTITTTVVVGGPAGEDVVLEPATDAYSDAFYVDDSVRDDIVDLRDPGESFAIPPTLSHH
jgi:hypothetical protein